MDENYEITTETLRGDLEEILSWLKPEIMNASKSTPLTEQGKKSGTSEFTQSVDAYKKIWEIYQAELSRDVDYSIKNAEQERKNCEYLENVTNNTREHELKTKELEMREKDILSNTKFRDRDIEVKERDVDIRETSAIENSKWWNWPITQTLATGAIILTVNGIALYLNASEAPLKNIFERWMIRVNPKL